ncbi:hypothetical protein SAMN04487785_11344 [Dyella jiangningensis]|uniref:hypothetical protein n=1 Tax=Dyella sp. AtDHG13 TaxID=1938897 RepID=UPI00088DDC8A|nr:hypothetical protein [Dyella sp. AtDHG13]PXV60862.1 hypothetical protein BDW41_102593 [Dyella sp. AtDHG13]SDK95411.1 hypothetical protein SAMN04487785_11344 [Dyella jiangningensis]
MASPTSDADIIQNAYAQRLQALFDNYVDVAPSDPDGAKAKFVAGVTFLRGVRAAALQALPADSVPLGARTMRQGSARKAATKKKAR